MTTDPVFDNLTKQEIEDLNLVLLIQMVIID
jgi:hypothetical protein